MADLKPLTDEQIQWHAFLRQLRALRKQIGEMECAVVGLLRPAVGKSKTKEPDYFEGGRRAADPDQEGGEAMKPERSDMRKNILVTRTNTFCKLMEYVGYGLAIVGMWVIGLSYFFHVVAER